MATAHVFGKHKHEEIMVMIGSYHETAAAVVNVHLFDGIDSIGLQFRTFGVDAIVFVRHKSIYHALTLNDLNR